MAKMMQYQKLMMMGMESCPAKTMMAGGAGESRASIDSKPLCQHAERRYLAVRQQGFALGGFFSLMSSSFAYEDPLSKASEKLVGTRAQTAYIFKEMGRNMWRSGKGFAKVGALYSGAECCIEAVSCLSPEAERIGRQGEMLTFVSLQCGCTQTPPEQYRAKNDIYNAVGGGFIAGSVLARNAGPKAMVGGGLAFAAFSAAIDLYIRKEPAE
jgi:import inner membrane translocase subunit TIM22